MRRAIFLFALALGLTGCRNTPQESATHARAAPNCVAAFLADADLQFENDDQKAEIARTLRDTLAKSPEELRSVRYADYTGKRGVWNSRELLKHYFLPTSHVVFDDECFYRDVSAPEARAVLQRRLEDLVSGK
jgi:hypothetical protein